MAYPNPTHGIFDIEVPITENNVKVDMLDAKGQLISSGTYKVNNGKVLMNIENKAVGVYYVKVYLKELTILKIIKQ